MPHLSELTPRFRKTMVPGFIAIFCLSFFLFVSWTTFNDSLKNEKAQAIEAISVSTNTLSSAIKQQIDKAQSLAVFTEYANEQDMAAYTQQLYSQQSELVEGWLLTQNMTVVNADGTTGAQIKIGANLGADLNHERGIKKALQTRRPVLVSQLNTTQNGSGIATINCYIPLFSYENNLPKDIKGTFIVLLNVNRLMGQADLLAATRTYHFALFHDQADSPHQTPIFSTYGKDTTLATIQANNKAVVVEFEINNAKWKLYATPIRGWQPNLYPPIGLALIGLVLALLSFSYLRRLISSHDELNLLVDQRTKQLRESNSRLETLNSRLEESFKALQIAQEQVIRNEKLASLGGLVSGVAHEINTPLGVAVTVSSYLNDINQTMGTKYQTGNLARKDFVTFVEDSLEGFNRLDNALQRVVSIVSSFKTITIDQTNLEASKINLLNHLETIIATLYPKIQEGNHKIQLAWQ